MDFLHGDAPDDELEAACCYEYARESDILCAIAALNKTAIKEEEQDRAREMKRRKKIGLPVHEGGGGGADVVFLAAQERFEFDPPFWFIEPQWRYIWDCPLFPEKGWLELDDYERSLICGPFSAKKQKIKPLVTHGVALIDSMGVLHRLQALAKLARQRAKKGDLKKIAPIIQGWPAKKQTKDAAWASVLFTLDFTKNKSHLLHQFNAWLQLPDVRTFRAKHEQPTTGLTGTFKDRLKALAAWRIYRELGGKGGLKFAMDNRKHDGAGQPRPFHDYRTGQTSKVPSNMAPLYSDEPNFCKAATSAQEYLAGLIPPWKGVEPAELSKPKNRRKRTKPLVKKMGRKAKK